MLSFFPLDVLDEIWDVIEAVLRDFLPTLVSTLIQCCDTDSKLYEGYIWLVVLLPFETVFQSISGRLPVPEREKEMENIDKKKC